MPVPKPWIVVAVFQLSDGKLHHTTTTMWAKNAASAVYRRGQQIHKQFNGEVHPRVVGISANPRPGTPPDHELIGDEPHISKTATSY